MRDRTVAKVAVETHVFGLGERGADVLDNPARFRRRVGVLDRYRPDTGRAYRTHGFTPR